MKLNFKLSLKPPFIIHDVSKRLSKDYGHWSDDWEKAVYKIKKYTNDNGCCNYKPYRTLNGETNIAIMSSKFGYKSEKDCLKAIEDDKDFYKENWNREYTSKVDWLDVC